MQSFVVNGPFEVVGLPVFVGGGLLERFCARRAAAEKRDVPRLEVPPVASGASSPASSAQQPRVF